MRVRTLWLACLLVAGLMGCDDRSAPPPQSKTENAPAQDESQFSLFAHANIPEVERLIDDLSLQIVDRKARLDDLAGALKLAQRQPGNDAEYRRWSQTVAELEGELRKVKDLRTDTFVQWRKLLLSPDADGQALSDLFDKATAQAMKHQEAVAAILAGGPAPVAVAKTPVPSSSVSTSRPAVSTLARGNTVTSNAILAVLPLRNTTGVELSITQAIFAGSGQDRHTVRPAFDQYAHGTRAGLAGWIATLGARTIARTDTDARLVTPAPAAAARGLDDAANLNIARQLQATHLISGQIDTITAHKDDARDSGRETHMIKVRFRIDLRRASDGATVASKLFEVNDTIIASQFRGLGDATIAARIARRMMEQVQGDLSFEQMVRDALR